MKLKENLLNIGKKGRNYINDKYIYVETSRPKLFKSLVKNYILLICINYKFVYWVKCDANFLINKLEKNKRVTFSFIRISLLN